MRRFLSTQALQPRVVFSGIQPTGVPHLGNYAGALRQWVQRQHEEPESTRLLYSIVDLHAITVPQKPEVLRKAKREALASLLAIGIDPTRCTLFYQSDVRTASVGYLSRMTQWKSKLSLAESSRLGDGRVGNKLKLGLFSYPVLQAADILVHRATHVPVGHDQQQHIEFAHTIHAKISSALTDSEPGISYDVETRPGISNLLDILSIFSLEGKTALQLAVDFSESSPRELKAAVSEAIVKGMDGIGRRFEKLLEDTQFLDHIAAEGGKKARQSADETMHLIREAMGL
ncbi:hypothetical protein LLEC1_00289 [Akanthomyces lecanii]|uniref:tryptophan--tRNA ligase n=1 Tax=Cordyceps confragosa TaxID=2714763 RepID=A0A179IDB0_CORDF|nr:hypothetical protein LLEC1_00289 [Akanthomyces lecanii]